MRNHRIGDVVQTISELTSRFSRQGALAWIGVRPDRHAPMVVLREVVTQLTGLQGDHYQSGGNRTVTLLQAEHLPVIASLAGIAKVSPEMLRRNLVVSGINLIALKNREFEIGPVRFKGTGICAPCSRMETTIGSGGYNAVRGHGGITALVKTPGKLQVGDTVNIC